MFNFSVLLTSVRVAGIRFVRDQRNLVATISVSLLLVNLAVVTLDGFQKKYQLLRERNLIYIEEGESSFPRLSSAIGLYKDIDSKLISEQLSAVLGVAVERIYQKNITCKMENFQADLSLIATDEDLNINNNFPKEIYFDIFDSGGYGLISPEIYDSLNSYSRLKTSMPMNICGLPIKYAGTLDAKSEILFSTLAGEYFIIVRKNDLINWFPDHRIFHFIDEDRLKWRGSKELNSFLYYIFPSLGLKTIMSTEANEGIVKLLKTIDLVAAVFVSILSVGLGFIVSTGLSVMVRENWHEISLKTLFGASRSQISLELAFDFLSIFLMSIFIALAAGWLILHLFNLFYQVDFNFGWNVFMINVVAVLFSAPFVIRPIIVAFQIEPNKLLSDVF